MKTKPYPLAVGGSTNEKNLPQFTQFAQMLPSTNDDDLVLTRIKADTLPNLKWTRFEFRQMQQYERRRFNPMPPSASNTVKPMRPGTMITS